VVAVAVVVVRWLLGTFGGTAAAVEAAGRSCWSWWWSGAAMLLHKRLRRFAGRPAWAEREARRGGREKSESIADEQSTPTL
jgi:hypothetical protein